MKNTIPTPERFTLPANETGNRLAAMLLAAMHQCERTATMHYESFEVEGHTHHVLVVEAGPRPREGEIASRMKQQMEAEWGTRVKKNARI